MSNKTKVNKSVLIAAGISLVAGIGVFTHNGHKAEKPKTPSAKTDIHAMKKNQEEVTRDTVQYLERDSIWVEVIRDFRKAHPHTKHQETPAPQVKANAPVPLG